MPSSQSFVGADLVVDRWIGSTVTAAVTSPRVHGTAMALAHLLLRGLAARLVAVASVAAVLLPSLVVLLATIEALRTPTSEP
jgi:predicted ABC-type sugar transport system permease subunit